MKRRAFTLTELLVVVGILLLLSTISLTVYSNNRSSDRARSAARIAQSAFLGAKDRAMNAKDFRGVRLTFDPQNANLVSGFVYVQPIQHDSYAAGSFTLERDASGNVTILRAAGQTDWPFLSQHFAVPGQIRLPASTGPWYQFVIQSPGVLQLGVPYTGPIQNQPPAQIAANNVAADIQFGFEVLPFHQPISLSSGIVVDLRYCSQNVRSLAPTGAVDVIFSPRGTIAGATGGSGMIYLCLRSLEDATLNLDPSNPACTGECLILSVNPQTGLVATFNADLTDADNDGKVDQIEAFARKGRSAGR